MAHGIVDFYPAATFSPDRASIIHWAPMGLYTKEVCITRDDVPLITSLADAPHLVFAQELGGAYAPLTVKYPQITLAEMGSSITIDQIVEILRAHRADLYITDLANIDYYLQHTKTMGLATSGLKLHPDCLTSSMEPMRIGFARESLHYVERPNPAYKKDSPLSPDNPTTVVDDNSVAQKLIHTLADMEKSGVTRMVANKYKLTQPGVGR
jgi:hypothetical protein